MANKTAKLIEIRENEKEIRQIAENAAKVLEAEHNITISVPEAIGTISYAFLREAINHLNANKEAGSDTVINMMQLFDMGISHRENEEAEKEGNFTPYLTPGQEFKLLVKDDGETEE
jgi:DNA polymerase III delta prime subunit